TRDSEPGPSPYVEKSDPAAGLVLRAKAEARVAPPTAAAAASAAENCPPSEILPPAALRLFGDERDDVLIKAVGWVISELRHQLRTEHEAALILRDRRIGALESELIETKGFLRGVLACIGGDKAKSAAQNSHDDSTVIDARGLLRRRNNVA